MIILNIIICIIVLIILRFIYLFLLRPIAYFTYYKLRYGNRVIIKFHPFDWIVNWIYKESTNSDPF